MRMKYSFVTELKIVMLINEKRRIGCCQDFCEQGRRKDHKSGEHMD